MAYLETLRPYGQNAQELELLYQEARRTGQSAAFSQAIQQLHTETPDQILWQAWFYRLTASAEEGKAKSGPNWGVAIGLSVLCGAIFWLLSDLARFTFGNNNFPLLLITAAPICALFIMAFLSMTQQPPIVRHLYRLLLLGALLTGSAIYVTIVGPRISAMSNQDSYLILTVPHLTLLAWVAIGAWVLWAKPTVGDHFAFLIKSFEAIVVGGLFVLAGGLFTGISFGLLETLGIMGEEWLVRLFIAGGGGLIPVLAVALTYDPTCTPQGQNFQEGISRLITTLMRLMLPLVLLFLVVYVALIPVNFWQPFQQREVLIVYNVLLFAVIGLLISATPVAGHHLAPPQERWLRRGLLTLAGLAVLISLYALTAIGYRTWNDGFTPNRVTIIGWNILNIALLTILLARQFRSGAERWLQAMYETFALGAKAYLAWAVIVLLCLPWLFMWASEPINFWGR
ncbi:MAG: hypothetical protein DYG89_20000 [Caldilinea sp. CFX5]|nr:hypothetical protein [Caldilinea sp. CFX5]